jgi:hypothetical protein
VQHTGEIDANKPLDALWLFGTPSQALEGFVQARIVLAEGRPRVSAMPEVKVEIFGDGADIHVEPLS